MRCSEVRRWLPEYLEGALPDANAGRLRAHLRVCAACAAEAREMETALVALARAGGRVPEVDLWPRFAERLEQERASSRDIRTAGRLGPVEAFLAGMQARPALVALALAAALGALALERPGVPPSRGVFPAEIPPGGVAPRLAARPEPRSESTAGQEGPVRPHARPRRETRPTPAASVARSRPRATGSAEAAPKPSLRRRPPAAPVGPRGGVPRRRIVARGPTPAAPLAESSRPDEVAGAARIAAAPLPEPALPPASPAHEPLVATEAARTSPDAPPSDMMAEVVRAFRLLAEAQDAAKNPFEADSDAGL